MQEDFDSIYTRGFSTTTIGEYISVAFAKEKEISQVHNVEKWWLPTHDSHNMKTYNLCPVGCQQRLVFVLCSIKMLLQKSYIVFLWSLTGDLRGQLLCYT